MHIKGLTESTKLTPIARCRRIELTEPYTFAVRNEEIHFLPDGCLLLELKRSGVCPADLRYVTFSRPAELMNERIPMCVFHEGIAEVMAVGKNAGDFTKGQRVAVVPNIPCYVHDPVTYPDKQHACKPCRDGVVGENLCTDAMFLGSNAQGLSRSPLLHPGVCVVPIPDDVPDDVAILAEILSVALRGVRCSGVKKDDTVLVTGAGAIGHLSALLVNHIAGVPKQRLFVTDISEKKLNTVRGFATTKNTCSKNALADLHGKVDKAFECAGGKAMEKTVDQALECAAPGGMIMLMGVHEHKIGVRIRHTHVKGLTLMGTQRSDKRDFEEALEIMREPFVQAETRRILHSREFPATAKGVEAACRAALDPEECGKVIINWEMDKTSAI